MTRVLCVLICSIFLTMCSGAREPVVLVSESASSAGSTAPSPHVPSPTEFVDPFIGTGGHGHTYPGAQVPFGMVQLSPDTRADDSWDGCGGYHYSDDSIIGFSHTHLSGTGVSDLGDILFMPVTGPVRTDPGTRDDADLGYRSRFRHETEQASPGFYSVHLDDYGIRVDLTATDRVGFHRYVFPKTEDARILVDLRHRDPVVESELTQVSDTEIEGYRRSKFWAADQWVFFVARFSRPIASLEILCNGSTESSAKPCKGKADLGILQLGAVGGEPVLVKVGVSPVSVDGARRNLDAEVAHWDFDRVRADARNIWERTLGRISVRGGTAEQRRVFYTSLYHSLLTPSLYQDVDGAYRGMDHQIHRAVGFTHYNVFSLWDTFRALHPLLTIIEPDRTRDFVITLIKKYEQSGELPMWELAANDTRCMIGYHAVSVIADAYFKGITHFDTQRALEAMVASADVDKRGLNYYKALGFVPTNRSSQSVSKTLEYAYDDWCIARFAKAVGDANVHERFSARARFFENVFDQQTAFARPRHDTRAWMESFDPRAVNYNFNFTEGNSYQYSLFVPHDIQTLIRKIGGDQAFTGWLDSVFETELGEELDEESDVSGLIGQYAHGNEPSHHIAYLYNFSGAPHKTQEKVRQILTTLYTDQPDGLCGNEDCGQMSAWYVFGAMGFYPVTPGLPQYVIGSPLFEEITIRPEGRPAFTISAANNSDANIYIQSATLNGAEYNRSYLDHAEISTGGRLLLEMGAGPNPSWGSAPEARPWSDTRPVAAMPHHTSGATVFIGDALVRLACDTEEAEIRYTTDGADPDQTSPLYQSPIRLTDTKTVKARAFKEGLIPSAVATLKFTRSKPAKGVRKSELAPGLRYAYYEGIFRSVYDFVAETPVATGTVPLFSLTPRQRDEWIGLALQGFIRIDRPGKYNFSVAANDGCQMKIDGQELFESDGRKSEHFTQNLDVYLSRGFHAIEVRYFQCSDRIHLKVRWSGPGIEEQEIPPRVLFHRAEKR